RVSRIRQQDCSCALRSWFGTFGRGAEFCHGSVFLQPAGCACLGWERGSERILCFRILLRAVSLLVPFLCFIGERPGTPAGRAAMARIKEVLNIRASHKRETGLAVRRLPQSARRPIAAFWFAVFA